MAVTQQTSVPTILCDESFPVPFGPFLVYHICFTLRVQTLCKFVQHIYHATFTLISCIQAITSRTTVSLSKQCSQHLMHGQDCVLLLTVLQDVCHSVTEVLQDAASREPEECRLLGCYAVWLV
jgi:hypothetical protein